MECIEKSLSLSTSKPSRSIFFLDIETTGLSKQKDAIFCIGIVYNTENSWQQKQWFIDDLDEEKKLLLAFLDFIKIFDGIFTYGGESFDLPFILARLNAHHLEAVCLTLKSHLDFKQLSLFKAYLKTSGISRQLFESVLGYKRQLSITGKELVKVYKTYSCKPCSEYKTLLLGHNAEELKSLLYFWSLYKFLLQLSLVESLTILEDTSNLKICFKDIESYPGDFSLIFKDFSISYKLKLKQVEISLTLYNLKLKRSLGPCKDYFYVPSQSQLIHRSLAQFIPTSMRYPATQAQCTLFKQSLYIKYSSPLSSSDILWYDENNCAYIERSSLEGTQLLKYIYALINPGLN